MVGLISRKKISKAVSFALSLCSAPFPTVGSYWHSPIGWVGIRQLTPAETFGSNRSSSATLGLRRT